MVHHSNHHGNVSALERQQLDSSQVGNGTVETAEEQKSCGAFLIRLGDVFRL